MSALYVENSASKKRTRFKTVRILSNRVRLNAQNALWIEHWANQYYTLPSQ